MAPQHDNPAARLRDVLVAVHARFPGQRDQEAILGWAAFAQTLEVDENSAAGVHAIASVIQLPATIVAAVRALGEDSDEEEHLLFGLDTLESALSGVAARKPLYQVFAEIVPGGHVPKSAAAHGLLSISRALHRANPTQPLSAEDLTRLESLITEMMSEVSAGALPTQLRILLLSHLHSMLQAVHISRVTGREDIEATFDALFGSVIRRPEHVESMRETGFVERFRDWINSVNGIISIGTGTVGLGQQVMRMLG
ncbi:hypothetical protein ACFWBF_07575 [Streptomyces sp. NPDC060028]|uniref:hypothetical protein n=1 Tax=Streptomyces sp. NPDC060028 TaxID=3347041 RepID=UPI0036C623E5